MKRLLLLLDSDPVPNSYDIIVGYGGADHIVSYGGITSDNVGCLIDGAVFTRGPTKRSIRQFSSAAPTWRLVR
jgi:methylenetetrahydrofolate/methylenetetrahydromethanopterin dehydrogenase (NADP+)